jgi:polar amino acid transport system substrate-binding protein
MTRLTSFFITLTSIGFLAVATGGAASAQDAKCEPDKVAQKYPGLAGKTIRIGQDGESPPYSFRDPKDFNRLVGMDAEMARATFECIGVPIEFKTGAWSGLLPAVISGQTDIMWDNLYYTPQRAQQADFVTYLTAATGGLVAKGNPKNIKSLDDVCGMRATAGLGTVEEAAFRDVSKRCIAGGKTEVGIVTYPDLPGGTRLIQNDRADVMMTDLAMVNSFVTQNQAAFERGFMIKTDFKIAVGYTKGNAELGKAVLDALNILRANGTEKQIFEKYGVDYSLSLPSEILTK